MRGKQVHRYYVQVGVIIFLSIVLSFGPTDALLSSSPAAGRHCRRSVNGLKWHVANANPSAEDQGAESSLEKLPQSMSICHEEEHSSSSSSNSNNRGNAMVEYSNLTGKLKTTPRVGWAIRGVPNHESVADHSWRVAALCFLLPRDQFNIAKCIEMAVVHDMAEAIVGDITPEDNIPKDKKQKMEMDAMHKIVATLKQGMHVAVADGDSPPPPPPEEDSTQYLLDIFHEYEERDSKEAAAVKDLDMLDMILQAGEYETNHNIDMSDFFDGTPVEKFATSEIREAAKEVHRRRRQRIEATRQTCTHSATPFRPKIWPV